MYESKDKMVSHPSHYQGANGMEVIDVIENFTVDLKGKEATLTGQIIKYILRWKKKNGLQDLEKTMWYLQRLIEHVRVSEESSVAAEELMDGERPTPLRGKPGIRCRGCVYDGENCLSPELCICDSNGNYTGYTPGPVDTEQDHRLFDRGSLDFYSGNLTLLLPKEKKETLINIEKEKRNEDEK